MRMWPSPQRYRDAPDADHIANSVAVVVSAGVTVDDRANYDIAYFYASRLRGEGARGIDDIHFPPAEPRTLRFTVTRRF